MSAALALSSPPSRRPPADAWDIALAYLPAIRAVARGFGLGRFDTDDLIQEGLLGARSAALRYDSGQRSFHRVAEASARNRMRDWLRWHRRHRRAAGDVARVPARADRVDGEALAGVLDAIDLLPGHRRAILREHFGLDGEARTAAAIGGDLGMSRDAVAKHQARALAGLRAAEAGRSR